MSNEILKFLNIAIRLDLLIKSIGFNNVEVRHIDSYLDSKYSILDQIENQQSFRSNLSEIDYEVINFLNSSSVFSIAPTLINKSEYKFANIYNLLDEINKHKIKNTESYQFCEELKGLVDLNKKFDKEFSQVISLIQDDFDTLLNNLYEVIYNKGVLLSNHPSHFVISKNSSNTSLTTSELKSIILDYKFSPETYSDLLIRTIDSLKELLTGSGLISYIAELRKEYELKSVNPSNKSVI